MGGARLSKSSRRFARARRLNRGRRGVAAVVGTLLALLVFFALFGIFLTQYLPLWMTDNESQFSSQAEAAFATLKSNVDAQYALGGPPTYGTPFPISSQAVPLLSQPTQALFSLQPPSCPSGFYAGNGTPVAPTSCVFQHVLMAVSASAVTSQNHPFNQTTTSALLQMQLPNRYYTPETFYFEDDAVVQVQPGGHQILAVPPPFNITRTVAGGVVTNVTVEGSFLDSIGSSAVVIGQGTETVTSKFLYSQVVTSVGRFLSKANVALPFALTYEIGTRNICGWYDFLHNATLQAGLPSTAYNLNVTNGAAVALPPSQSVCLDGSALTYDIILQIYGVTYASLYYSGVGLTMGVGGG